MADGLRILLVEDDEDDYYLVRDLLAEIFGERLQLDWRQSWQLGLEAIKQGEHDLCLLDYYLGAGTGIDLVEQAVRSSCTVPIILLTGHGDRELDLRAMRAGASDFLDKGSLTVALLDRAIRYTLVRHRANKKRRCRSDQEQPAILLVEDDEDDYLLTNDLLKEVMGREFELDWVTDWQGALAEIDKRGHDVYLVDYRLGEMTGLDLVREAVAKGSSGPFILLTGQDSREIDIEAMKSGASDFLVKGDITAQLLDRAIRYAIERSRGEQRLSDLAQFDQLTGLANRSLFRDYLTKALARAQRTEHPLAVMFLDLDRFKIVNDTLGHDAGDQLLQQVAQRLRDCVRASDLVARLGGDEFTVVVDGIVDLDMIGHFGERILEALKAPFDLSGNEVFTSASIGIAVYPHDADDIEELIKSADVAMYRAKEEGANNYQFYTMDLHVRATKYLTMEQDMRAALDRGEFSLYYQPQLSVAAARVDGFEALVRWFHPKNGTIPPSQFIPVAEDSGLIVPIGEWVLRTACTQAVQWRELACRDISVAVNFSARQFQEKGLQGTVARVIEEARLPPHLLDVEITESSILKDPEAVRRLLKAFSAMGLQVSLDDFGTGYSSLNHLRSFPGATIKIDQSFVNNVCTDPDDAAIVEAIICMAHNLRLKVVAEGVETVEQFDYLAARGCDVVQGFYFSRPIPADRIGSDLFLRTLSSWFSPVSPVSPDLEGIKAAS